MQLFSNCPHCAAQINIKSYASDRSMLERERGEVFEIRCDKCRKRRKVHVNEVRAKISRSYLIAGLVIGALFGLLLLFVLGYIALATFLIPIIMASQEKKAVHGFNTYLT